MKLADFLAPARVLVPLGCETLDSACSALLARLAASGTISDVERLQSRIAEERGEDMVAIADRAFCSTIGQTRPRRCKWRWVFRPTACAGRSTTALSSTLQWS